MKNSLFRIILLLSTMVFVLACSDSKNDDDDSSEDDVTTIDIFSWWTSPGEAEALDALTAEFVKQYPDMDVVNLSAEVGDGQDAHDVLADRMAADNPPDVFQLGPRDFQDWVEYAGAVDDNRLEPLDALYEAEGWTSLYPQGVLDVVKYDGHYYAVPVNMHRQNTLFYNTSMIAESELPTTMAELLTLAASLDAQGIVPVAVSAEAGWTLEIIFFSVLSGSQGPEFHDAFYSGAADMTDAANVAKFEAGLDDYLTLIGYANDNAGEIGWDAAAQLVYDGTAAMYIHGDWAKGYFQSVAWLPGQDFNAIPVPGSEGEFIYNVDAFALCEGAPHREEALNFLKTIGGADAQEAFNILKGSTPVHPDVNTSGWDDLATATVDQMNQATIMHNVEINQFSVAGGGEGGASLGMADQLHNLFQGKITRDALVTWVTENYIAATE